ncbi:MAG: hypothetical protein MUF79_00405 [Burkholderiales bacterium]|jgi:hypothetical protein|nr:hypothetical protein [Burkholderiales bacterium]
MIRRSFLNALGAGLAAVALALCGTAFASPDTSSEPGGADTTLARFFALVSGGKGEARDRETLKSLFRSDARFVYTRRADGQDAAAATLPSPESFIDVMVPLYERVGRREKPRWMHGDTKGDLAVIRVQYEWWDEGHAARPVQGMKFVTLVRDGGAWRIAFMAWQDDAPTAELAPAATPARAPSAQLTR